MASWILVKWIDEDRLGVIPCSWVVEPTLIVKDDLPKKGVCFWKKKSATFDPGILNTSGKAVMYQSISIVVLICR
jgi:hypothetical protein